MKCPICNGKTATIDETCWLCINPDCRQILHLNIDTCDSLSWWMWRKLRNEDKNGE